MPLIHVHYPAGTLSNANRDALAEDLGKSVIDCEELSASPFLKSTLWIYFNELPTDTKAH